MVELLQNIWNNEIIQGVIIILIGAIIIGGYKKIKKIISYILISFKKNIIGYLSNLYKRNSNNIRFYFKWIKVRKFFKTPFNFHYQESLKWNKDNSYHFDKEDKNKLNSTIHNKIYIKNNNLFLECRKVSVDKDYFPKDNLIKIESPLSSKFGLTKYSIKYGLSYIYDIYHSRKETMTVKIFNENIERYGFMYIIKFTDESIDTLINNKTYDQIIGIIKNIFSSQMSFYKKDIEIFIQDN